MADLQTEIHRPGDRNKLSYLAATKEGHRIYLNRTLVDADQAVVLTGRGYDPLLGYSGAAGADLPGLADADSVRNLVPKLSPQTAPDGSWPDARRGPRGRLAARVAVLRPGDRGGRRRDRRGGGRLRGHRGRGGPRGSTTAGSRRPVSRRTRSVVALSGDPDRHDFAALARAAAAGARAVKPGGDGHRPERGRPGDRRGGRRLAPHRRAAGGGSCPVPGEAGRRRRGRPVGLGRGPGTALPRLRDSADHGRRNVRHPAGRPARRCRPCSTPAAARSSSRTPTRAGSPSPEARWPSTPLTRTPPLPPAPRSRTSPGSRSRPTSATRAANTASARRSRPVRPHADRQVGGGREGRPVVPAQPLHQRHQRPAARRRVRGVLLRPAGPRCSPTRLVYHVLSAGRHAFWLDVTPGFNEKVAQAPRQAPDLRGGRTCRPDRSGSPRSTWPARGRRRCWRRPSGSRCPTCAEFLHMERTFGSTATCSVRRHDPLGLPGYDLVCLDERAEGVWRMLRAAGATPAGQSACETLRSRGRHAGVRDRHRRGPVRHGSGPGAAGGQLREGLLPGPGADRHGPRPGRVRQPGVPRREGAGGRPAAGGHANYSATRRRSGW